MNHDDATRTGTPGFRHAGDGQPCSWRCARCTRGFMTTLGSAMQRVQGVKQRVCAGCKR